MPPTAPNPNAEPGEEWKVSLRKEIEQSLLPMLTEARQALDQKLEEAPVGAETRDRLAKEHSDTLKNIRRIAEDLFQDQIEQERQQLRWAQGGTIDREWSGGLVRHQQAIMEQIAREKRLGSRTSSSQIPDQSRQQSQPTPGESPTSERDGEYFSRDPSRNPVPLSPGHVVEDRVTGRPRNASTASGYEQRYSGERTGDYTRSAIVDEPEEMDRPPRQPYPDGKGSLRRQSTSTASRALPEIWKPSISPEEDAAMSRPSALGRRGSISSMHSASYRSHNSPHFADRSEPALARQGSVSSFGQNSHRAPTAPPHFPDRPEQRPVPRQGSVSSIGSHSYVPQSTSQIPEYPEPTERNNVAAQAERERAEVQIAEEQWSGITRAREREARGGQDTRYRSGSGAHRTEEHTSIPSPTSTGPSPVSSHPPAGISMIGPRPIDPRSLMSSLTTSRPLSTERPFTMDESTRTPQSSSPLSHHGWAGPARTPMNIRSEPVVSRSPPIVGDGIRMQQPAHLRPRVSTQNLQGDRRAPMMSRSTSDRAQTPETDDDDDWEEEQREQAELAAKARREAMLKVEEVKRMAEEAQRKEADARRRAEEAERIQIEAKAKEEAARLKEEETQKKEAEIKRREEEVRRREEDLERREAEAKRKEEEKRRKQEEERRKQDLETRRIEAEKREAMVKQREEELERREAEARRKEGEERRREEEEAREREKAINSVQDMLRREREATQREQIQQEEFRKREEEIRRRAYERRSQEGQEFIAESVRSTPAKTSTSPPSTGPWPIPKRNGSAGVPSQADRSSTSGSSWTSSSSRPSFNPSTPASSTRTSTPVSPAKPAANTPRPTGFTGAGVKPSTSPHPSTPTPEAEWARRQEEQARKQQEAFRREQEQQELKRQAQASKILSKEDVLQLFAVHERQWAALPGSGELRWHNFPWPVWKPPKDPEDLTSIHIGAYVLSQYYPGDKSKSSKDRIKEHIRRWHPDRFETKYLPKVREEDREKVKEGAGVVARVLNEMLTRSNVHDVFS